MCGICGFVSKEHIELEQLRKMNNTMYHRGSNDSGEEIFDINNGYSVGLAQRRLSIIDLSSLGHQPMHSSNNRIAVSYNGEIYNFLEIKEQLKDYPFKSKCDTEVILAAYIKWGIKCVDKFNGMFAIAIFDKKTNDLYLVRDRIGKKPLYYWFENGNIVFASELKPIMEYPGFGKKINKEIIKRYLYQHYINEPYSVFENVFKVEPGQIVKFTLGKVEKWKYWDVSTIYNKNKIELINNYEEAKKQLKDLLRESVKKRMISDVPIGSFLSGGYDSSLVTAVAQELSGKPIKTYAIGFNDEDYNEAEYAKQVANYLGTNHTEQYIDEKTMFEMIESIPQYYDEPFADNSQIPTMLVSRVAANDVTVVLSGDGGDEFFCGYTVYDNVYKAQQFDSIGSIIYKVCQIPVMRNFKLVDKLPFSVRIVAKNRNNETKTQFSGINYIKEIDKLVPYEGIPCLYLTELKYNENNWQERRMLLDQDTFLPADILCKVDRASMKYSIEARCPILDVNVIEYSYKLPHRFKYSKGIKKRILKDIAYEYIPKELLERPKKGFNAPIDNWLRGALREHLLDVCNKDFLKKQGIFNGKNVNDFVTRYLETGDKGDGTGANYSRLIWSYYIFQQWYEYYMR